MGLPGFSVRRPVTIDMIFLGIILLGVISWTLLPQELLPPVSYPQLTVVTNYPNAAPEEVETLITKIIEEAVGTVKGARRINSVSKEGTSLVTIEFNWNTDMNFAALGMREKIDLIKERLPREAEEPIVMKFNPNARPIMILSVTGDWAPQDLYDIAKTYIKDRLEKVEGVASCGLSGGLQREIQINVNGGALQASNIDLLHVVNALRDSNLNYPAGTTEDKFFEWLVRTIGEFGAVSDIPATVIAVDDPSLSRYGYGRDESPKLAQNRLIQLTNLAEVVDGFKERTSYSRYNGRENVSISIQKQADANTIRTAQKVLKELKKLRENLPGEMSVEIVYDQSRFIRSAIGGVTDAAWQGGILVILVLLFFLKNLKDSLIVASTIPVSVMVAIALMYFSGISINMISLFGLAIGVGMLVDCAIVVIDNIFRHAEMRKALPEAAEKGADEVNAAITSSALTTVAVFLPLAFVVGVIGQVFKDMAFTITYSIMASLYVALTLIPRLIITGRGKALDGLKFFRLSDRWLAIITEKYMAILKKFLANRRKGLAFVVIIFAASMFLMLVIDKEFMPKIDEGEFIMALDMPTGTTLDATNEVTARVEGLLLGMKDVSSVSTMVGSNKEEGETSGVVEYLGSHQAQMTITLKKKRRVTTNELIQSVKNKLADIDLKGGQAKYILSGSAMASLFQGSGAPIAIEVKGNDLGVLKGISEKITREISGIRGTYDVKTDMKEPSPETKVVVDKDKAALYNLSVQDIARTAQIAVDGWVATKYKEEGKEIDVRVRLREEDRKDFAIIKQLRIQTQEDTEVPLNEVAVFEFGKGPSEIKRIDKERTVMVTANFFGKKFSDIIGEISICLDGLTMPAGYSKPRIGGEQEQMLESFSSLQFALLLSVLLIYMIMAAEFESLWQPFIIMFTVPMGLIGVVWALFITRISLNVVALFGVVLLGGIVVDNGIVLIDFVNGLVKNGTEPYKAVMEGAKTRLRPIFMTMFTTVLGLVPLALGIGEGAELQRPLAVTVMGGMIVSTFLTLVVLPALYLTGHEILTRRKK